MADGKRPGPGRASPPLAPTIAPAVELPAQTPEEFLGVVMNDPANPIQTRMDAAELLMRYGRSGGRGKKATLEEAAKAAAKGISVRPSRTRCSQSGQLVSHFIDRRY